MTQIIFSMNRWTKKTINLHGMKGRKRIAVGMWVITAKKNEDKVNGARGWKALLGPMKCELHTHWISYWLRSVITTVKQSESWNIERRCNEQNLRQLYPSYVNNNISWSQAVFTTILLIDDGILFIVAFVSISKCDVHGGLMYETKEWND